MGGLLLERFELLVGEIRNIPDGLDDEVKNDH
jgi:hypothetical protein